MGKKVVIEVDDLNQIIDLYIHIDIKDAADDDADFLVRLKAALVGNKLSDLEQLRLNRSFASSNEESDRLTEVVSEAMRQQRKLNGPENEAQRDRLATEAIRQDQHIEDVEWWKEEVIRKPRPSD